MYNYSFRVVVSVPCFSRQGLFFCLFLTVLSHTNTLLQLQSDTDDREKLLNEIAQLRNDLSEVQTERDRYKNELDHVKTLNMFSFGKWKREN